MSGMYEMKPVRLSKRSSYIKFTGRDGACDELPTASQYATGASDSHLRDKRDARVPKANRDFFSAVKAAGKPIDLAVGTSYDHSRWENLWAIPMGPTVARRSP